MPLPSLFEQYANFCRAELARHFERPAPGDASAVVVVAMLLTARARRPAVRPRVVHVSRELERLRPWPSGLEEVLDEVRRGESLVPRLSRKAHKDPASQDRLFNDWGVQHLHLGVILGRFAGRTGTVLFARIAEQDFYALGARGHGMWADKGLIDVIHRNWPSTIADYRLEGATLDDQDDPTSEEIASLRGASITTLVSTSDGTVYVAPGGGLVGGGLSSAAVQDAMAIARSLTAHEKAHRARAGAAADLELVRHGDEYTVRYRSGMPA